MLKWLLICLVALGVLLVLVSRDAGSLAFDDGDLMGLVAGGALLLFIGISALSSYRGRMGQAVRDFMVWVGLALALVAVYAFRDDLTHVAYRVAGELLPPGETIAAIQGDGRAEPSVRIRRRGDGHFVARTDINGAQMRLLVDTGATTVVLRPADAAAAGIDTERLSYTIAVQTANGTAYAAPIRLRGIAVGPILVEGVEALVAQPGALRESLLGMSFLRRLRSYEFSGDFLTLRG